MKVAQAYGMGQPDASDTQTTVEAEARMAEGYDTKDWNFSTRCL